MINKTRMIRNIRPIIRPIGETTKARIVEDVFNRNAPIPINPSKLIIFFLVTI